MAFSDKNIKNLGDVLLLYPYRHHITQGFKEIKHINASISITENLQFVLDNIDYKASDEAICEFILSPILLEVWKPYLPYFSFWSHKALQYDDFLKGMPDFLFSKKSARSHVIFEQPYVAVVEAKLDDFIGGWAQCALEMIAMQKINNEENKPIYGIVTNGDSWEFAMLRGDLFTQYKEKGRIENLSELLSILTHILSECKNAYISEDK